MSLLLRSRSFAAVSLVLVGAGLVAIACGSDSRNPGIAPGSDTSTSGNQPNNPDNGGSMTPGNSSTPGSENPAGGTQNPANSGTEGPMGNIPVQQNPQDNPGSTNNPNPGEMNPPATSIRRTRGWTSVAAFIAEPHAAGAAESGRLRPLQASAA